jgi:hypothetical protein
MGEAVGVDATITEQPRGLPTGEMAETMSQPDHLAEAERHLAKDNPESAVRCLIRHLRSLPSEPKGETGEGEREELYAWVRSELGHYLNTIAEKHLLLIADRCVGWERARQKAHPSPDPAISKSETTADAGGDEEGAAANRAYWAAYGTGVLPVNHAHAHLRGVKGAYSAGRAELGDRLMRAGVVEAELADKLSAAEQQLATLKAEKEAAEARVAAWEPAMRALGTWQADDTDPEKGAALDAAWDAIPEELRPQSPAPEGVD